MAECVEALSHLRFGRLACSREDQPYIVPIYFAYHDRHLYRFATRGQKIDSMRANPRICVEAEEIVNHHHWLSVVVLGRYEELLWIVTETSRRAKNALEAFSHSFVSAVTPWLSIQANEIRSKSSQAGKAQPGRNEEHEEKRAGIFHASFFVLFVSSW